LFLKSDDPPRDLKRHKDSRRIAMLTLERISSIGSLLYQFLRMFADCFSRRAGRQLLMVYVQGQLSDIQRKNCEAIALTFNKAPRTLQRFLESIKWNEEQLRDRCQQIIARDHAHPGAIGLIDESGTHKSGDHTVGVARQYNGNRGKIENCTTGVHLGYSAPGFQCLLDSRMYLPESWADDPERLKKTTCPRKSSFKPSSRSLWHKSSMPCQTAFRSKRGHSMKLTARMLSFSTGWRN
jgi:SRSO17 transposase